VAPTARRSYAGAAGGRLTSGWASPQSTADAELFTALQKLRGRSRELVRNSAYAKRARTVVINNVIGSGIGMQAQVRPQFRERLDEDVNDSIERAWEKWARADACHTGGRLHFADLERVLMGEVFEAGEVLVRLHPRAMGMSDVPLALEVIESERLADDYFLPSGVDPQLYRMGVEVDEFQRPVAYWIRDKHPGDVRPYAISSTERLTRVPAEQILHLAVIDRWPQSRGVPWLHAAMRRLNDMDGYSEAEIIAARGSAAYMAVIKTDDLPTDSVVNDGRSEVQIEPGLTQYLKPGEDIVFNNPSRPNPNFDPFMRAMLREVASGIGVSYESLSRDYSQSNYSSSRLALLDDRDLWRTLQQWFVRSFREPLHRRWLELAVMARAIPAIRVDAYALNPDKFAAVKFKPRGWSWIDPTKDVEAYRTALMSGFITRTDVIAATASGLDIEDIDETRQQELKAAAERGLVYDTDPEVYAAPPPAPAAAAPKAEPQPEPEDDDTPDPEEPPAPPARLVSFGGARQ
jgi:lambda family phage portal protein